MVTALVCLDALLDLALEPGWDSNYENFDKRKEEIEKLYTLIETEQIIVYLLPFLLCIAHMDVKSFFGIKQAQRAIRRILEVGNSHPGINYERAFERSNTVHHYPGNTDLYDVMCLVCGTQLNVDAIVTRDPHVLRQLVAHNSHIFSKFNIPILSVGAFVNLVSEHQINYISREEVIYVFTPHNSVIKLPHNATPIDFAYKIHTKLGHHCVKAVVNGQEVSLDRPLKTGDVVEIFKEPDANPDPSWLNSVVTRTAKQGIRQGLKQTSIRQGWKLVKQVFGKNTRGYRHELEQVARLLNQASVDDLVSLVGAGEISLQQLQELTYSCSQSVNRQSFCSEPNELLPVDTGKQNWRIASCCTPLPGDTITGVIGSHKRTSRIHRSNCPNIRDLAPQKLRSLMWNRDHFHVQLKITLSDQPDIFRLILNELVENSVTPDLRSINISDGIAKATIGITIRSRSHLEELLSQISNLPNVLQVELAKPILLSPDSISEVNRPSQLTQQR